MKRKKITSRWFFTHPPLWLKPFLIFVYGDALILLPFWMIVLLIGFFSLKFMFIIVGIYWSIRSFGEMIYWLLQQFGDRSYRPYDYGFTALDNNAIYIIYQLCSLVGTVFGISFLFFIFLFFP